MNDDFVSTPRVTHCNGSHQNGYLRNIIELITDVLSLELMKTFKQ